MIHRWPSLLLVALLCGGCTLSDARVSRPPVGAQALFVKGLEQVLAGQKASAFVLLEQKFPASPWSERARSLAALTLKMREQDQTLRELQAEKDRCSEENARLAKEAAQLGSDLKKLKNLLIENELRSQ